MKRVLAFADEAQFDLSRSSVSLMRTTVFEKWKAAVDPDEKAYYLKTVNECDALMHKHEAILLADTSQDAAPEEDEDEA